MAEFNTATPPHADYGLDAPGVIRILLLAGLAAVAVGIAASIHGWGSPVQRRPAIGGTLQWTGSALIMGSILMYLSSRWGKLRARDRMLDRLALTGTETILDVGCGHGLMLIGAAKRLPRGKAIGVDLWSQIDQKSNSSSATMANARAEGIADRVEVRDGDMRALPLADASIDVVVSSLAIHNVKGDDNRRKAIEEIVRVLKPGGRVGILDIAHVKHYANDLRDAGMRDVTMHGFTPWIYPPTRVLTAVK